MKPIYNKLNKMRTPIRFLRRIELEDGLVDFYISKQWTQIKFLFLC